MDLHERTFMECPMHGPGRMEAEPGDVVRCARCYLAAVEVKYVRADYQRGAVSLAAFRELLDLAEDMRAYVPDQFAQKWKHDDGLAVARAALDSSLARKAQDRG